MGCAEVSDLGSTTATITKGQIKKLEEEFKDKYHYEIAVAEFAKMERTYAEFCSRITKMDTSSKVDQRMNDFHSEEIEKEKSAYKIVQDAMIANGMPKFADATPADLQKKITVGDRQWSGKQCYDALRLYKDNIATLNAKIESNNHGAAISSQSVEQLEPYKLPMRQKLQQVKQNLEDYVKYRDFYLAGKNIESFRLSPSQISEFCDIDEKIKRKTIEFKKTADDILHGNISEAIKSELNRPSIKITDNDLL
jgi:disulfide oxidoreductase YuzD